MACNTLLTADIVNDCSKTPVKGLRYKAWAFNRSEVTLTATNNVVSAITMASGKTSFTLEGFKDFLNAGHDAVVEEDKPTSFTHYLSLMAYAATAAEKANIDKADDIVVVVERNGAQDTSSFILLGKQNGLFKTSQTRRANDNKGTTTVEFATREGQGEEYSEYIVTIGGSYAATLAALVATETV